MRNFDEDRAARVANPLTFQIAGRTFSVRPTVRPAALELIDQIDNKELPLQQVFASLDSIIKEFLVPDDGPRWDEVRQLDGDDAVGIQDLSSIVKWLSEEALGQITSRPTEQPGGSTAGRATTGTTSTADSSSPDEPAA